MVASIRVEPEPTRDEENQALGNMTPAASATDLARAMNRRSKWLSKWPNVACAKSSVTSTMPGRTRFSSSCSMITFSELPPRSKKLSVIEIGTLPKTFRHAANTKGLKLAEDSGASSLAVHASRSSARVRTALRSTLPLVVMGMLGTATRVAGTIGPGRRPVRKSFRFRGATDTPGRVW